jgi:hypothetical protein
MLDYLKWLPLLAIIARHPHSVQALQDSLPDVMRIASRFQPYVEDTQQLVAELMAATRQIEGLPAIKPPAAFTHALNLIESLTEDTTDGK